MFRAVFAGQFEERGASPPPPPPTHPLRPANDSPNTAPRREALVPNPLPFTTPARALVSQEPRAASESANCANAVDPHQEPGKQLIGREQSQYDPDFTVKTKQETGQVLRGACVYNRRQPFSTCGAAVGTNRTEVAVARLEEEAE